MKTRTQSSLKQRGFSLLTGFILVIIMFGSLAFFLAGQGINAGFGSLYSNTAKTSSLLTSAGYINTGFDAVTLGGTSPTNVTFDTATTGIFNPTTGGASPQPLDPSLFQLRGALNTMGPLDGYWIYRKNQIKLNGVGTFGASGAAEYTVIASGLKDSICRQINNTLHGTALTVAPSTLSAYSDALLIGNATTPTSASPNGVTTVDPDLEALGTAGWINGCYATTTVTATVPNYVYIHTLLAQ